MLDTFYVFMGCGLLKSIHLSVLTDLYAKELAFYYIEMYASIRKLIIKDLSLFEQFLIQKLYRNKTKFIKFHSQPYYDLLWYDTQKQKKPYLPAETLTREHLTGQKHLDGPMNCPHQGEALLLIGSAFEVTCQRGFLSRLHAGWGLNVPQTQVLPRILSTFLNSSLQCYCFIITGC